MRTSRLLFAVSAAASLSFLLTPLFAHADWTAALKVLSILPLCLIGYRIDFRLGTALALSAIGDFLLGVRHLGSVNEDSLFLLGLGSFLVAHIVYISLFTKYWPLPWWKPAPPRTMGVVAILVAVGIVLGLLHGSLGSLLVPVVVYSLVLAGMGISALLADLGNYLACFGALLFIGSDTMLAIGKFRGSFPAHQQLVWITYYLAQCLILWGVQRSHERKAEV